MRVAINIRVCTRDKGQDTENQLRQLRAWCEAPSHDVASVYEDRESGKQGRAEREAFDRLFRSARIVAGSTWCSSSRWTASAVRARCRRFITSGSSTRTASASTSQLTSSHA